MIGSRIRRKRLAAGLSLQELSDRLKTVGTPLTRAALSNYETGKSTPSAKALWGIAKVLEESLDYFMAEKEVTLTLQGFRKKAASTKGELDTVKAYVEDEIEKHVILDQVLPITSNADTPKQVVVSSPEDAEKVADNLRAKWDLGSQPIASVTTLLEDHGWYVVEIQDGPHVDGFSGYVKETNRHFAVSRRAKAIDRIRLNLLHEAGHSLLRNDDQKLEEKCANRFAASFLLPRDRVKGEFGEHRSSLELQELLSVKKKYGISMQATTFRLRDTGVISESYFTLLFTYYSKMSYRKEEPGSEDLPFQEHPLALQAKVHRALAEGLITEQDALRMIPNLRLREDHFASISSAAIKELMHKSREERDEVLRMAADAAASDYEDPELNISDIAEPYDEHPSTR